VVLLGPRGSGKTTLLRHLETWGRAAPLGRLDMAAMDRTGRTLFDALSDLAYQLQARKDDVPPLGFPSFAVLLLAAGAAVSTRDRPAAVAQMQALLQGTARQEFSFESLQPLLDAAAALTGGLLPAWATQIVPIIRSSQRLQARVRLGRRIARASQDVGGPRAGADFLVSVNQLFHGYPEQQREAERLLMEAFLADLRAAYEHRSGHGRRTTHCLILLDDTDSGLGDTFLQLLLNARAGGPARPGRPDPLLVLATARRPPEALAREERRLAAPPDPAASWAADGERFTPVPVGRLHAGVLRDLTRAEVEGHAKQILGALPDGAVQPGADTPSYWLGWAVHAVTRGQPAATGAVLDALSRFPAGTPWDERIQGWPAMPASDIAEARAGRRTTVADAVLDWLLADFAPGLRSVVPRAAAALTQGQAEAAQDLWRGVPTALVRQFEDRGQQVHHPLVRFLLLRALDASTADGPGSWNGAHAALARAAGDDARTVAYHELARGRLDTAVDYLHGRFHTVSAAQWCEDLARIQRAPSRLPGGRPQGARERYTRLVGTPWGDEERQAITRLLTACWITAHPPTDPLADAYQDPLGDPYAELYSYVADEFRTLRRLTRSESDRDVFKAKAAQYERKPW
jgi:hypothetical protein